MHYDEYKFKFYLNASHSIYINGVLGEEHPHTWEIIIYTIKLEEDFIIFNDVEKYVEDYIKKYQDLYINEVEPFTTLNPTLENICKFFKEKFRVLLLDAGWILLSIEISETPTRSYIIDLSREFENNYEISINKSKIMESSLIQKLDKLKKYGIKSE
ncbi:6-carboxytetrahydropterin synthase [Clostridium felsineum]|uniref:6-carboxy-5,6,7,8-tetrahydropterin synthase n=1 Tax=Clostridium felsineum TaxID=36839 RepID=A0A1S8L3V3_9CLOT|nr:6-carboxytetrahydropterin synthase [Clostridium felsineum]MCR3760338.1 6-carboxytetrahydropterin synthase [Clostridium felsineum]URZ07517.1 hypothetical protein CLROS_028550 [Clostridium felsineum]URZ12548.1 hypothetical protein CROST_032700 [Clostridium felsineum]